MLAVARFVLSSFNPHDVFIGGGYLAEKSLAEHTASLSNDRLLQAVEDDDLCSESLYSEIFTDSYSDYVRYDGLDDTALFAGSVSLSEDWAIVGSNGYNIFQGIIHVYVPISLSEWSLHSYIRSPSDPNANFGVHVSLHNQRIITSANGYKIYDGRVFIYDYQAADDYWKLVATIDSPLAGINISQGFGYRVGVYNDVAVVSTAVNNAYIYEKNEDGSWELTADLEDLSLPGADAKFGRSVAIWNDYVAVGAPGVDGSSGAVYVYHIDRNETQDGWYEYAILESVRGSSSYYGTAVDIDDGTLLVGAQGFVADTFEPNGVRMANNTGYAYFYDLDESLGQWNMTAAVQSPVGNDGGFGVSVAISKDSAIIGADGYPCGANVGAGFVYHRDNRQSDVWLYNASYESPAGSLGHFGFAVDISDSYSAIGAYGYNDLQGSIYLAARTSHVDPLNPTSMPSTPPSATPTAIPTSSPNAGIGVLNFGDDEVPQADDQLEVGLLIALFLAVLLAAGAAAVAIYCCCCIPVVVLGKKKKKKEEEEKSSYTVHSYAGYSETDDYDYSSQSGSNTIPDLPYQMPMAPPPPMMKKDPKNVKFMEDGQLREMFPYKVYGPRGYSAEGNDSTEAALDAKLKEKEAEEGVTPNTSFGSTNSSEPPEGIEVHNPKRTQQYSGHSKSTGIADTSSYSGMGSSDARRFSSGSRRMSRGSSTRSYSTGSSFYSDDGTYYSDESSSTYSDEDSRYSRSIDDSRTYYTEGGETMASGTQSMGTHSHVQEAKDRYRSLQRGNSGGSTSASASASGINRFREDAPTPNSRTGKLSLVEQAKLRAEKYRQSDNNSNEYNYKDDGGASVSTGSEGNHYSRYNENGERISPDYMSAATSVVSKRSVIDEEDRSVASSVQSSYVEQAKARYANIKRSGRGGGEDTEDDRSHSTRSTHSTHSSRSSKSSHVQDAKARYAALRRSNSGDDRSLESGSIGSDSQKSLVEAAKSRYASLKRTNSGGSVSDASIKENLVMKAKARYEAYRSNKTSSSSSASVTSASVQDASVTGNTIASERTGYTGNTSSLLGLHTMHSSVASSGASVQSQQSSTLAGLHTLRTSSSSYAPTASSSMSGLTVSSAERFSDLVSGGMMVLESSPIEEGDEEDEGSSNTGSNNSTSVSSSAASVSTSHPSAGSRPSHDRHHRSVHSAHDLEGDRYHDEYDHSSDLKHKEEALQRQHTLNLQRAAEEGVSRVSPLPPLGEPMTPNTNSLAEERVSEAKNKLAILKARAEDEEAHMRSQLEKERSVAAQEEQRRVEEDNRIEQAVNEARARAEATEIEARAAAKARADEESIERANKRAREREEARLRAEERARANFAKFKAESDSQAAAKVAEENAMRAVVEKAKSQILQSEGEFASMHRQLSVEVADEKGESTVGLVTTLPVEANTITSTTTKKSHTTNTVQHSTTTTSEVSRIEFTDGPVYEQGGLRQIEDARGNYGYDNELEKSSDTELDV